MKRTILLALVTATSFCSDAQDPADTNFVTIISAASWLPGGKTLLLNMVKFDKSRKVPPVFRGYRFDIEKNK